VSGDYVAVCKICQKAPSTHNCDDSGPVYSRRDWRERDKNPPQPLRTVGVTEPEADARRG
jgi:hypothetical protein